jgi:hypothetical protein
MNRHHRSTPSPSAIRELSVYVLELRLNLRIRGRQLQLLPEFLTLPYRLLVNFVHKPFNQRQLLGGLRF